MKSDKTKGRYAARGVSAGKEEVHAAVDRLDPGLFVLQDYRRLPDRLENPLQCYPLRRQRNEVYNSVSLL